MTTTKAALIAVFEDGDIPTGANFTSLINSYPTFYVVADSTALAALSTMIESDVAYQQDIDTLFVYDGAAWDQVGSGVFVNENALTAALMMS